MNGPQAVASASIMPPTAPAAAAAAAAAALPAVFAPLPRISTPSDAWARYARRAGSPAGSGATVQRSSAVHRAQELGVRLGGAHVLEHELHRVDRRERVQHLAE